MKEHCKGKTFSFMKVSFQNSCTFFINLLNHTLIISFCDVAFEIRPLLFMASSMFGVVQQLDIGIIFSFESTNEHGFLSNCN